MKYFMFIPDQGSQPVRILQFLLRQTFAVKCEQTWNPISAEAIPVRSPFIVPDDKTYLYR